MENIEPEDGEVSSKGVLKSPAGFYIGRQYWDAEIGAWLPYSRDSQEYYAKVEEATSALLLETYTPRTRP